MTYEVFSIISQPPSIVTAITSREMRGTRLNTRPSSQNSKTPCSMWVNEYGSTRCCELCGDHMSHDQGTRSPARHHRTRPCRYSLTAAAAITPAMISHGRRFGFSLELKDRVSASSEILVRIGG